MTGRQWGLTVLLVVVPSAIVVAALWQDRDTAAWRARATTAEAEVQRLEGLAEAARGEAAFWRGTADSLRVHRDTLVLTRWRTITDTAYLGADTTLQGCREALAGFRSLCRQALDSVGGELAHRTTEADGYRAGLVAMTRSDSLRGVALDSLHRLLRAVPAARKWYIPRVVAGVGCAGGTGFACGLLVGVGVTIGGAR
jgi:hypothetical protein